jgi:hypothetical protein
VPLTAVNFINRGPLYHADLLQFYDLFVGNMADQAVFFNNALKLNGGLSWQTDSTYDVGASGANRPHNLYLGNSLIWNAGANQAYINGVGGTIEMSAGSSGGLLFDSPSTFYSTLDARNGIGLGGPLTFDVDNQYDVGTAAASRPRTVYAATSFVAPLVQLNAGGVAILTTDAAGALAQRNGTNPQAFNIYNTYTDANNYERLSIHWTGGYCYIETQNLGTGPTGSMVLTVDNGGTLYFQLQNGVRWTIDGANANYGNLLPHDDLYYDIGSPTQRVRNLYVGTSINGPGAVPTGGAAGQHLAKNSATSYDLVWATPAVGLTLPLSQTLTFSPDNTYDIGAAAASRPRSLYVGTSATIPTLTVSTALTVPNASIPAAALATGAAASNVGALGGALGGTLPNPSLAAGAAAGNIGTLGGVLSGTLPNPGMAAGAAATNVGTLSGVLTGTLPNPGLATGSVTSAVIADGTIATADLANAAVSNAKLGPDVGRDSMLTNGGFEIWQRGVGPFAAGNVWTADRWSTFMTGSDTMSVSRDATNQDVGSNYCMAVAFTLSGGTGNSEVYQILRFSDGHQLLGVPVTFSVRVKASAVGGVRLSTFDGTTQTNGAGNVGTGAYETISVTITPSANTYYQVNIQFSISGTYYLDNAVVAKGSAVSAYVPLPPAEDLARCLRYYEVVGASGTGNVMFSGYYAGGATSYNTVWFKAVKAVTPTVTKNGTWSVSNANQPTLVQAGTDSVRMDIGVLAAGQYYCQNLGAGNNVTAEANP